jgi:hypothetical protein
MAFFLTTILPGEGHLVAYRTGVRGCLLADLGQIATRRLKRYEERYRELARQLGSIGYIAQGSLAPRFTRCGRATCACSADPPKLHGPYWHWSTKVNGKTVNRRLSERQATL